MRRTARYLVFRAIERLGFALDWFDSLGYAGQMEVLAYDHLRNAEELEVAKREAESIKSVRA